MTECKGDDDRLVHRPQPAALENQFGLADRMVDEGALANSIERFREQGITLPRFREVADPSTFDHAEKVGDADPQDPMPATCGVSTGTTTCRQSRRGARARRAAARADRRRRARSSSCSAIASR